MLMAIAITNVISMVQKQKKTKTKNSVRGVSGPRLVIGFDPLCTVLCSLYPPPLGSCTVWIDCCNYYSEKQATSKFRGLLVKMPE